MKYLRKFENEAAYSAYTESEDYVTPNVCLLSEEQTTIMNKRVQPAPPVVLQPLKITILKGHGTIGFAMYDGANSGEEVLVEYMEWSLDGENWVKVDYDNDTGLILETSEIQEGGAAYFRGSAKTMRGTTFLSLKGGSYSEIEEVSIEGNLTSLFGTTVIPEISEEEYYGAFENLFNYCETIKDASKLILPANVTKNCYKQMFNGCANLTTAPALPATTLAESCYSGMFNGCDNLVTAPELPATTLAQDCYSYMFYYCASLTTAPELPATTLAQSCYNNMFSYCTSLTTAPVLSATTLAQDCYSYMFIGCTSLTTAPELPATTLAPDCYQYMFSGCTSLTTAPVLSATSLAQSCYEYMFSDCTSLTTAPELPSTTLAQSCYSNMFSNCTSLTTAPVLSATTLVQGCYKYMFNGCTSLNQITCLATDISSSNCTPYWAYNVAANGTFIKASSMTGWTRNENGIPSGWTVEDYVPTV